MSENLFRTVTPEQKILLNKLETGKKIAIYLAGRSVFRGSSFEEKKSLGQEMKDICERYGFTGLYPLDNEIESFIPGDKDTGKQIFEGNYGQILKSDIVIGDVSNFRGKEPDSGTITEITAGSVLGKMVYGYNIVNSTLIEQLGGENDDNGFSVENFGGTRNLMVHGFIEKTGGKIIYADNDHGGKKESIFLQNFEQAIQEIKEDIDKLKNSIK